MAMPGRGNRNPLLTDEDKYTRILREYKRVEDEKDRQEGEHLIEILIISICLILTIGSFISILHSIRGA